MDVFIAYALLLLSAVEVGAILVLCVRCVWVLLKRRRRLATGRYRVRRTRRAYVCRFSRSDD